MNNKTLTVLGISTTVLACFLAIGIKINFDLFHQNTKLNTQYTDLETSYNQLNKDYDAMLEQKNQDLASLLNGLEQYKEGNKKAYILAYNNIAYTYSDADLADSVYDCFTQEQIQMMWKCIETETFECNFDAKVNVANVILNRVEDDLYPTDPVEIITDTNQFAYGRNVISEDTKLALEYAFINEDTTNGCIGFRSDCIGNPIQNWNNWTYSFSDGCHCFYSY